MTTLFNSSFEWNILTLEMGSAEHSNVYEEVRRKNIERNANMMRTLGLLPSRVEVYKDVLDRERRRHRGSVNRRGTEPRRSARLATEKKAMLKSKEFSSATTEVHVTVAGTEDSWREQPFNAGKTILTSTVNMDDHENIDIDYSTDGSSRTEYEVHVNVDGACREAAVETANRRLPAHVNPASTPTVFCLDSPNNITSAAFGSQFQELVIRALMQSTASLIGPPPGVLLNAEGGSTEIVEANRGEAGSTSTWNEATFMKAESKRKRRPLMLRTSAGEDSDSQEDFPIPDNESPQQRALRTRRLNRSRARKAKELTNNRKAVKKSPYVIHVDGTGKARGILKHQWRAAVRGQCGRFDPTMDNINHHPKHVVDSIWHALEKEWEFEGFAHRAREMFEKSATKFMRNRKMQLKYKCQRNCSGSKPNDISDAHWSKIVDLTKKSSNCTPSSGSSRSTRKEKDRSSEVLKERMGSTMDVEKKEARMSGKKSMSVGEFSQKESESLGTAQTGVSEQQSRRQSPNWRPMSRDAVALEESDVDAKIQELRTELLRLQNSRKLRSALVEDVNASGSDLRHSMNTLDRVSNGMKENVLPWKENRQVRTEHCFGNTVKAMEKALEGEGFSALSKYGSSTVAGEGAEKNVDEAGVRTNTSEVECGDIISMVALIQGRREDIGKGILMGFAGSKCARKVIPKGWCSIKVSSYTGNGGSQVCPFPAGWKDQVKCKTVRDADGQTILWPHSLLHI